MRKKNFANKSENIWPRETKGTTEITKSVISSPITLERQK